MNKLIPVFIYLAVFTGQNNAQGQSQEKISGALSVRHIPNPVEEPTREGDFYKWQFTTEVRNNLIIPLQITHFGFYFYEHGKWVLRNIDQRMLTQVDFTQRYSKGDKVVGGWIQPGEVAINRGHWVKYSHPITPRGKWAYIAEDFAGNVYHAEAEIEIIPPEIYLVSWAETDFSRLIQISGRVLDENDRPIAHAHLHLSNFNNREPINTVVAGEDGAFSLEAPKPGLFRLFIFALEHERFSIPLTLVEIGQKVKMDINPAPHDYVQGVSDRVLPAVVFRKENTILK